MKIGVALSGSGRAGLQAHLALMELEEQGIHPLVVSASGISALPALLWAKGLEPKRIEEIIKEICQASDWKTGTQILKKVEGPLEKTQEKIAISCVDSVTGMTVIYGDFLRSDAWNLRVRPLKGYEDEAIMATLSPYDSLEPLCVDGMKLCDFSVRYGCPLFSLKMAGMERLLALNFLGGATPAQMAADSLNLLTSRYADLHYEFPKTLENWQRGFLESHHKELYHKLLF